jgi:hypothetical protein
MTPVPGSIGLDGPTAGEHTTPGGPRYAYPEYREYAIDPITDGEGVAVFLVYPGRCLFVGYQLSGRALELAEHRYPEVRALQAIGLQQAAREQAGRAGHLAVVT